MRSSWSKVRDMLWAGLLVVSISGCGNTPASAAPVSQSAPASASHSKTLHKHSAVHIKGVVTAITSEHIVVKTKSGTVWT
ncbi:MAG: hypothetical protein M1318_06400, partial [Firmicutes bacterium]|nr:hypothetical protein [Bacillota bacterium]